MKTQEKKLYYLSELSEYKIDDGYPDVRGWEVKDSALRSIGKIKNLLVNKKLARVVYLDIEVDATIIDADHDPYGQPVNAELREFVNEKGENHIIIPIGLVDINMDKEYVFTESVDHTTFASTKRIRMNAPIERGYENAVLKSYQRGYKDQPVVETLGEDIENEEVYRKERMEKIKKRHKIGEYREGDPMVSDGEVHSFDAEHERAKVREELDEEDPFYGRREFDDTRFKRNH